MLDTNRFFYNTKRITLTLLQSFWLFFLYFSVGYVMVGSLGSLQLRDALEAKPDGVTFDEIKSLKEEFETRVLFIRNRANRNRDTLYQEVNFLEADRTDIFESLIEIAATLDLEKKVREKINSDGFYTDNYYFGTLENIKNYCDKQEDPTTLDVCWTYENYQSLVDELDRAYSDIDNVVLNDENSNEMDVLEEISMLRANTPYIELFGTYTFMHESGFSSFLHQPRELLVLQLTMVMGTLGSLVTMTWLFIHRDTTLGIRRTLFLPLVGSVSAFIIFVFFKAGQLTISSGPGESSLSPFFLSFVGIISGLLSERAYARMELVGKKFFTIEEGHPRWGIHLKTALAAAGLNSRTLAAHAGLTEKGVQEIVDEVKPASDEEQALIAACLRMEVRQLFTDEPPKAIKKEDEEQAPQDST